MKGNKINTGNGAITNGVYFVMFTTSTISTLGGSDGVNTVLQKNERLPCNTCQTSAAPYLQGMGNYLKDVKYFADNYAGVSGSGNVLGATGIKSNNVWQVEGAAFVLRVLNENHSLLNQISGFEQQYTDVNQKVADIVKVGNVLVECKSWSIGSPAFNNFKNGTSGSYSQFLSYLQNGIAQMADLEYWFDARKESDVASIKQEFQSMMLATGAQGNSSLTTQGQQVFNAIWANVSLRGNLFPNVTDPAIGKDDFELLIENISSSFYSFIKVK